MVNEPGTSTWGQLIRRAILGELWDTYVARPGLVDKYYPDQRKADIKPLIQNLYDYSENASDPLPIIPSVPVIFPSSSEASISWPLKPNDGGLLVFSDRSLEKWLSSGADVDPQDVRMHELTDAFFIVGLFPFQGSLDPISVKPKAGESEDFALTYKESEIRITPAGDVKINGGPNGKLAIGNGTGEFLEIVNQLLTALTTANAGGFPLDPATLNTVTQLIANLGLLKGSL